MYLHVLWQFVNGALDVIGVHSRTGWKLASAGQLHAIQSSILVYGGGDEKQSTLADHRGEENAERQENANDHLQTVENIVLYLKVNGFKIWWIYCMAFSNEDLQMAENIGLHLKVKGLKTWWIYCLAFLFNETGKRQKFYCT